MRGFLAVSSCVVLAAACGSPSRPSPSTDPPTLVAGPRINATRYVAFGDSITQGKLGPASYYEDPRFSFPDAYAKVLYGLMSQRYAAQTIDMYDAGAGGELVQPAGLSRFPAVLSDRAPQVVLILEGANDLINGGSSAVPGLIAGLTAMVKEARGRNMTVFLATLPPQRPGGKTGSVAPLLIVPTDDRIRELAASEGAVLVDVYQAFGGSPDPWIDADGLHPTADGYRKIAETFFATIRSRLEVE